MDELSKFTTCLVFEGFISKIDMRRDIDQDDWVAWKIFTKKAGGPCQVVGDNLTVTNVTKVKRAIDDKPCNALLIRSDQ